jgi:hypothetical protein
MVMQPAWLSTSNMPAPPAANTAAYFSTKLQLPRRTSASAPAATPGCVSTQATPA